MLEARVLRSENGVKLECRRLLRRPASASGLYSSMLRVHAPSAVAAPRYTNVVTSVDGREAPSRPRAAASIVARAPDQSHAREAFYHFRCYSAAARFGVGSSGRPG